MIGLFASAVAVVIIYLDVNSCPVESITGPDFGEFMTLVGHKNEAVLAI